MTSIVTGDIINSRNTTTKSWLPLLKSVFTNIGTTPKAWEIFRGDSFQFEVYPEKAFKICLLLKATLKTIENLDVRISIGIGNKTFDSEKITESNGTAFVNSGYAFDNLLKKQTLVVNSPWKEVNEELNIAISLALLVMDNWTTTTAVFVQTVLQNPNLTQKEIGGILKVSQANISKTKKRAGLDEILRLEERYQKIIHQKINAL